MVPHRFIRDLGHYSKEYSSPLPFLLTSPVTPLPVHVCPPPSPSQYVGVRFLVDVVGGGVLIFLRSFVRGDIGSIPRTGTTVELRFEDLRS